jgi:hypothetical protein
VQPHSAVQDLRRRELQDGHRRPIDCFDPGAFGKVTITKSITIDCHDVPDVDAKQAADRPIGEPETRHANSL